MTTKDVDVAVIGGGLAGVTAALAFALQGRSVRMFERRDLARDPNRGDILHPPTMAVIRKLGLAGIIDAKGATTMSQVTVVSPDGVLAVQPHHNPDDYRILNHAEMETAIMEEAEAHGVTVIDKPAKELVRDGDAADAGWLVESEAGTTRARFLVGADGASSLTRRTLGIEYDDVHEYDHWLVVLHADTPDWLGETDGWTLYHPEGAVFILPTTPKGRIRVVVIVHRDEAREWMTSSEEELARRLGDRHPDLGTLKLTKRGGSHVYQLKRTNAATYIGPHAALTGDAVHTTHTWGGQGLNMAIQDSSKLAELVGPVLADPNATEADLEAALVEYEALRKPIATTTLARADMGAEMSGPSEASYQKALEFYDRVANDPEFLKNFSKGIGGKE